MRSLLTAICFAVALAAHSADDVVLANLGGGSSVVTNAVTNALLAKTGQTTSLATADDGDLRLGAAWPTNRFTVLTNTNCVRDNLTGFVWARNANYFGGATNWNAAISNCNALEYGGQTDWRLPNVLEQFSLVDHENGWVQPSLTTGHPFVNVQNSWYWTSTAGGNSSTGYRRKVTFAFGNIWNDPVATACYVWPVRGPDWTSE